MWIYRKSYYNLLAGMITQRLHEKGLAQKSLRTAEDE